MGKTMVIYRVTPRYMGRLDETISQVKGLKAGEVADVRKEPIGFGVTVLRVGVIVPEKEEGAVERVSAELNSLELVEEAEQQEMTLL